MKLYATITSERASKGQGGNFLDVEIIGTDKQVVARIKVTSSYPYKYDVDVFPVMYPDQLKLDVKGHGYRLKRMEIKGKKEKGERNFAIEHIEDGDMPQD